MNHVHIRCRLTAFDFVSLSGRCGEPPTVEHATRDGPAGQKSYPLGTQLTYTCSPGYSLDGFFRAMCVGEGRWVGPRLTCSREYDDNEIAHWLRSSVLKYYTNPRAKYLESIMRLKVGFLWGGRGMHTVTTKLRNLCDKFKWISFDVRHRSWWKTRNPWPWLQLLEEDVIVERQWKRAT